MKRIFYGRSFNSQNELVRFVNLNGILEPEIVSITQSTSSKNIYNEYASSFSLYFYRDNKLHYDYFEFLTDEFIKEIEANKVVIDKDKINSDLAEIQKQIDEAIEEREKFLGEIEKLNAIDLSSPNISQAGTDDREQKLRIAKYKVENANNSIESLGKELEEINDLVYIGTFNFEYTNNVNNEKSSAKYYPYLFPTDMTFCRGHGQKDVLERLNPNTTIDLKWTRIPKNQL